MRVTHSPPLKKHVSGAKRETAGDQMSAAFHAYRLLSASAQHALGMCDLLCLELEGHRQTMLKQVLDYKWNKKPHKPVCDKCSAADAEPW